MDSSELTEINSILTKLCEKDESSIREGVSYQFLEFIKSENNELQVNGNAEGLLHLSRRILELVVRNNYGSHQHFDEAGIVDHCDMELIISLKKADWD